MIIVSSLYVSTSTTGAVVTFPPITVRPVVNLFELHKVGGHNTVDGGGLPPGMRVDVKYNRWRNIT
jgi:hypothetical protein